MPPRRLRAFYRFITRMPTTTSAAAAMRRAPKGSPKRPMNNVFEEFPDSHVLMATDYPHYDSEFPHTVSGIRKRSDLTDRQKDMILGENAAAILRM